MNTIRIVLQDVPLAPVRFVPSSIGLLDHVPAVVGAPTGMGGLAVRLFIGCKIAVATFVGDLSGVAGPRRFNGSVKLYEGCIPAFAHPRHVRDPVLSQIRQHWLLVAHSQCRQVRVLLDVDVGLRKNARIRRDGRSRVRTPMC